MSALKDFAGLMLGRLISSRVIPALMGLPPGRYPHPKYGPVEIPEQKTGLLPFRLTTPGFFMGYAALIVYLARREPREARAVATETTAPEDAVEECLTRSGWNLTTLRRLRDSIADKSEHEEDLTADESRLLEAIEGCLDQIQQEQGSLESVGLVQVPCDPEGLCGEEDEK